MPNTNCPSDAITRTNHSPSEGNVTGSDVRTPPGFDRMLTNRTTSGDEGSAANGFSASRPAPPSAATSVTSSKSFWEPLSKRLIKICLLDIYSGRGDVVGVYKPLASNLIKF